MYNKTSIKRNILTIKKIHREVGRAKDLSAPLYNRQFVWHIVVETSQFVLLCGYTELVW